LRKLKNRSLKYQGIREIKAVLKICVMALIWTLKKVCKDTPVLMAGKNYNNPYKVNFGNSAKAMAVAASMPIVAVPIQDVQLLEYAVAHKTVNAGFGLEARNDEDVYLGLTDKDPYTSDQQRERDEYEINDTEWNEVVFEELYGGSIAKLALHNDLIRKQSYKEDAVFRLNLPEMGINGLFEITSIKHIIPQKKPVDEDEADDYNYKPVTELFIHESSDVWKIRFDNGEELGVTHNHPIYSTTKGGWEFAGELEIGEEVLTKDEGAKVISKEKDQAQQVYNLEVKDYHNFLVNASEIVVHNTGCLKFLLEPAEASKFADEIIEINKKYSDGSIFYTTPSSAISSALYHENSLEQGAAIFNSIARHMFNNGNKRTAADMIILYCQKANIPLNKSRQELLDIAQDVASRKAEDGNLLTPLEIAAKFIE